MSLLDMYGLLRLPLLFWLLAGVLLSACTTTACVAEHILAARIPNTTPSQFLKPTDPRSAPTSGDAILLLFVHGLFGDTKDTWKRVNGRYLADFILDQPEFAERFDAFAFGFPTSMLQEGSFNTPEAAKRLVSILNRFEVTEKYNRIVIVAHSMGGLVALEALTTYHDLREKVPLVVTFGTPYDGAHISDLGKKVLDNPAILDMQSRDGGNGFLISLANRWKQLKDKGLARTTVTCAYEKVGIPRIGLVVPPTSASSLCDGVADPIAADHILMVKPDGPDHDSVTVLTNALRGLVKRDSAAWSGLTPLPDKLPPPLERSGIGPRLLGTEPPIGPTARLEIDQKRKANGYFPPGVDRLLYLSPRYPAGTPRRLQLLAGLDAVMNVIAVDDTSQGARVLSDTRTVTASFVWPGATEPSSVRFVVMLYPLSREAQRLLEQTTQIGDLVQVR